MKTLKKAARYVGKAIELVFGLGYPSPRDLLAKHYPYMAYAC